MAWIEANLLWMAIGAALLIALFLWLWLRRRVAPRAISAPKPAAPLQPVRPDIVPAKPAEFAVKEDKAEPVAPAAVTAPAPAPVAAPADGDNLALIKGLGPKLVALLADLGVTRFEQIAAWSDADMAAIDAQLGVFAGRPARDNWVDQAGFLARGDKAGFEAKYGALGGEL